MLPKAKYNLWFCEADGRRIAPIHDALSIDYTKIVGDVGMLKIDIPLTYQPYHSFIKAGRQIHVYRNGYLETIGIIDGWDNSEDSSTISCSDGHLYLKKYIIAYYEGSTQALKNMEADKMMREIVDENLLSDTDYSGGTTLRDLSSIISIDTNIADVGTVLEGDFAFQNVLDTLQDIQSASRSDGNEVFFGMYPKADGTFLFRTFTGQPGNDRTNPSTALFFSYELNNLVNPNFSARYNGSANVVYAGGQGHGSLRTVQTATNPYLKDSVSRSEKFVQAMTATTSAGVLDIANQELAKSRQKFMFTGSIIPTERTPYGNGYGWNLGDKIYVRYQGLQYTAMIRAIFVSVKGNEEKVRGKIEVL